jgi:hypothetical protein
MAVARTITAIRVACVLVYCMTRAVGLTAQVSGETVAATATILVTSQPVNTFVPSRAFGAALDGLQYGDVTDVYTPTNMTAMRGAGLVPITYRIRTELGIEAWHWNPQGTWSDSAHAQGYWTSAPTSPVPITVSYGYRLPRRGTTIDQANEDGYSRLDDGDPATFWKSNPYLDPYYTHEPSDALGTMRHPPWVVIDFQRPTAVDAIRIQWADPYATRCLVQWWDQAYPDAPADEELIPDGTWRTFASGTLTSTIGGDIVTRIAPFPVHTRMIRILVLATSHTALPGSHDVRDSLGVAIREISAGVIDAHMTFHDAIRHVASSQDQTVMYVSSTDPWHRAEDRDLNVEQPGFDQVYQSGLTQRRPMMVPVGVLYDTPENAVAELRYLQARQYPVERIEMGEEPDGQSVAPEDYAALYLQFANALHHVDSTIALGGPSFQDVVARPSVWPDTATDRSWMRRFLNVLQVHHRMRDFSFFSFEWYPYDNVCVPTAPQLLGEPVKLAAALDTLRNDGVPTDIPWIISEYGYSAFAGEPEVTLQGALLNADIVGQFLTLGGNEAYLYGYEPTTLLRNEHCNSWGNNTLLLAGDTDRPPIPVAAYYGAQLLTQRWAQPGDGVHHVYRVQIDPTPVTAQGPLVTAYAAHRPDGQWAVMFVNKDPTRTWSVRIAVQHQTERYTTPLRSPIEVDQLSPAQYVWHTKGSHGFPAPDHTPVHAVISRGDPPIVMLPPSSMTVVRGRED